MENKMSSTASTQNQANNAPTNILAAQNNGGGLGLLVWTILLLLVNLPLTTGGVNTDLLFLPEAVQNGQWWRLVTYPLVHLSWYHLLLDGGAFLLLWHSMEEKYFTRRIILLGLCSAGSISFALWLGNASSSGLTGLSGIAHGLMAYTALEMLMDRSRRKWGLLSLAIVTVKSIYELACGRVVFAFMHLGLCGLPVAACHAGGVLGGLIGFLLFHLKTEIRTTSKPCSLKNERKTIITASKIMNRDEKKQKNQLPLFKSHWITVFLWALVRSVIRTAYRVRCHGLESIPETGPAVLVCNHVSYLDALIIGGFCRRPVRFVMHADYYNIPVLRWIFGWAGVIPINSARENPSVLYRAFNCIGDALKSGEVVCLFPEGRLTRTGEMDTFRPGIEKIIQRNPVPVVPLALRGLWGSFFSHKNGPPLRHRPRRFWSCIELAVGQLIRPQQVTADALRTRVLELMGGNL
jgi:rhomboid family GlyGly-CTERM serine protease